MPVAYPFHPDDHVDSVKHDDDQSQWRVINRHCREAWLYSQLWTTGGVCCFDSETKRFIWQIAVALCLSHCCWLMLCLNTGICERQESFTTDCLLAAFRQQSCQWLDLLLTYLPSIRGFAIFIRNLHFTCVKSLYIYQQVWLMQDSVLFWG